MNRVVHFEIRADDVDRATAFYQAAFGWSAQDWGGDPPYRFLVTGAEGEPGIDGAVVGRGAAADAAPVEVTIEVVDVHDVMNRVKDAGGTTDGDTNTIPGVGTFAHVIDTEGNRFTLIQRPRDDA